MVTYTGMDTEMGAIAAMLDSTEEEPSPLTKEVEYLGKVLGIAVIFIAAIVMATSILMSPTVTSPRSSLPSSGGVVGGRGGA